MYKCLSAVCRFFWARQFPTDDKLESIAAKLAEARQATARKEGGGGREGGGGGKTHCHKHAHTEAEAWCTDHDVALCRECVTSLHKPCSAATPINKAASQRKQEVNDMRTHLDTLRDSFEKELANLDVIENSMAAGRRRTLEDIDEFYNRMLALLADKKEELRARAEEEYDKGMEAVGRKRGAWKGMVEEIEETSVVAEMLYMQASSEEVLSQFAALKQQFDNLQHMMPALASPQVSSYRSVSVCFVAVVFGGGVCVCVYFVCVYFCCCCWFLVCVRACVRACACIFFLGVG